MDKTGFKTGEDIKLINLIYNSVGTFKSLHRAAQKYLLRFNSVFYFFRRFPHYKLNCKSNEKFLLDMIDILDTSLYIKPYYLKPFFTLITEF